MLEFHQKNGVFSCKDAQKYSRASRAVSIFSPAAQFVWGGGIFSKSGSELAWAGNISRSRPNLGGGTASANFDVT